MGLKKTGSILILISSIALVACGKRNNRDNPYGDNSNGVIVDVPTASYCMNGSQAAPSAWAPYQQYGFQQYNWNYGQMPGADGFCGCPQGYQPACGGTIGMTCVPVLYMQNQQLAWWGWNSQTNNFYNNTSYAGYGDGIYAHSNNAYTCTSNIGQLCQIGSNCGGYGYCQQIQPGSSVGVCVRH